MMNRGYGFLSRGKANSPPRRDRAELQRSSQMASHRRPAAVELDLLNIDEFGDMGSDEDDFQTLAANTVPIKPPAQPQYNLVPHGFLRDDDELVDEDYDGVPIGDSATSSPKPESPVWSPWKSSQHKQEIKGDPITVLGSGNRPNPLMSRWPDDVKSQAEAHSTPVGAHSSYKLVNPLRIPNPQQDTVRWDRKPDRIGTINSGYIRNCAPLIGTELSLKKGQNFVRAHDDCNPYMNKSQTSLGNVISAKEENNPFLQTFSDSTKKKKAAKPVGNTFPQTSSSANRFFPTKSTVNPPIQSSDEYSSSWGGQSQISQSNTPKWTGKSSESSQSGKEQFLSVPNQLSSQIELLQAAALQKALTGITQLDPQTGLNLLMQATQNPALAAVLAGTINNTGLAASQPSSISHATIEALVKPAGTMHVPVSAVHVTQSNLGVLPNTLDLNTIGGSRSAPRKLLLPDGSGATRYPAPNLSSMVFDPSTGYRFDDSTGLHYDANSGYFFNSKLNIYLRWDKFTETYLRVETPPGVPRFINPSRDPSAILSGESLAFQDKVASLTPLGKVTSFSNLQNTTLSKETDQSSKGFTMANQGVGTLGSVSNSNFLEQRNTVQANTSPALNYSEGSHSFVDSRFHPSETNVASTAEQKLSSLPNLAETSLFNKLRKAKLAAQAKPDRKRWGEPDPLLEAVQKHTIETNKPQTGLLNLEDILQRSRQFMKGTAGDPANSNDGKKHRPARTNRSPIQSGGGRRIRSRSRSPGRPSRLSQSPERLGNRRGKYNVLPQSSRALSRGRSPDKKPKRGRPHSKGRSPINRARGRRSSSPQLARPLSASRGRSPNIRHHRRPSISPESKKRRSASRSRSPNYSVRMRQSPMPEARKEKSASRGRSPNNRVRRTRSPDAMRRGRSPIRRKGKLSKSLDTKCRRITSKSRSSNPKIIVQVSNSPEHKIHKPKTPDQDSLNRSLSPVVKVVLNQSPGGSKVRNINDEKAVKSTDSTSTRQKLSTRVGGLEKDLSPGGRNQKGGRSGSSEQIPVKEKLGLKDSRDRERGSHGKEKIMELKAIPFDTSHGSGNKSRASKNKVVSGYKPLSNLRNQVRDEPREKGTDNKCATPRCGKSIERQCSGAENATAEDDERGSRANQRLVSERTFSTSWKMKRPDSVTQVLSSTKSVSANRESNRPAESSIEASGKENDEDPGVANVLEESNDFDFLNDTLDDDKESTIIDEYEEILDYQELDSNSESKVRGSTSADNNDKFPSLKSKKSLCKESMGSPVIDLCLDPSEQSIETSTSVDSVCENQQSSCVGVAEVSSGDPIHQGPNIDPKNSETLKNKHMEDEDKNGAGITAGLSRHDAQEVVNGSSTNLDEVATANGKHKMDGSYIHVNLEDFVDPKGGCPKDKLPETLDTVPTARKGNEEVDGTINELFEHLSDKCVNDPSREEIIDNEEWNVLDSVDGHEEANANHLHPSENTFAEVKNPQSEKMPDAKAVTNLERGKESPVPKTCSDLENSKTVEQVSGLLPDDDVNGESGTGTSGSTEINKEDSVNSVAAAQVTDDGESDDVIQRSIAIKESKEINLQAEEDGALLQARCVSDIEKFLLLSSQEVEAKREQGIESNTSNTEKKSGVFSRLGEKLREEEARKGSTTVLEPKAETPISPQNHPNIPSTSALPDKRIKFKSRAVSIPAKNSEPEDPCKALFVDEPTPTVLLGPMDFIEPLGNFQQFTQKYMQNVLNQENVHFKKIYVHHADGTGAPYHYILITFPFAHVASDWVEKHKGIYKCEPNIFKRTAGHTKHKLIHDSVAFLHFTEPNWMCKVCKKSNFPPRSLCFGCFQNKDPDGFSPLIILDKGRPPWKHSTWVGTPKLKFFATKEKVIESAPPLDGFDIQRIEMIMDEEMGLPAGICVFELPTIVEAGKFKKYLNHRDVEAVAVDMSEEYFKSMRNPQISPLRKKPPKKFREELVPNLGLDPSVSGSDVLEPLSEDREGSRGRPDFHKTRARSPRFTSQEVRVSKLTSSKSQERPFKSRVQSQSPTRHSAELHSSRINYRSPRYLSRHEEDKCPSPEVWSVRTVISRGRAVDAISPRPDIEQNIYPHTEKDYRSSMYQSPSRNRSRSPVHDPLRHHYSPPRSRSPLSRRQSPVPRHRSPLPRRRSPPLKHRSPSPRHMSPHLIRHSPSSKRCPPRSPPRRYCSPSAVRPSKPDGRSDWSYPPPDPKNFRFEPRSGLDYDPTTTLYYEPKSCCFYNDDSNEWLEYDPRTGCYRVVQ